MVKKDYEILKIFRKEPNKEFSTSHIVKEIENEEYALIQSVLSDKYSDKTKVRQAKEKKARLHRKTLYHLSNLVQKKILKQNREGKRGEKFFVLAIDAGEEIILDSLLRKSIKLIRPKIPDMEMAGYERSGIVHKVEEASWISRVNSILVECHMFKGFGELRNMISVCFTNINDSLALNDFQYLMNDKKKTYSFLSGLNSKCKDYGRNACCIVKISEIKDKSTVKAILREYLRNNLKQVYFIFDMDGKNLKENELFFMDIIKLFLDYNVDLYIKNNNIHKAPYIIGKFGPYTFDDKEWELYEKELKGKLYGLLCAQSTVLVDVEKLFRENSKNIETFNELIDKIVNSLLISNSLQRRKSTEFFESLINTFQEYSKEFFMFSRNYIRFWNYGWNRENFDQEFLLNFMSSSKEKVNRFCFYEDTIYKSCGMPTRFRVAFSCVFDDFVKDVFTRRRYKQLNISDLKDFYREDILNLINVKEHLFDIFDGGDLMNINKIGSVDVKNIVREISFILNSYNIHFFRYRFSKLKEVNISLDKFIK